MDSTWKYYRHDPVTLTVLSRTTSLSAATFPSDSLPLKLSTLPVKQAPATYPKARMPLCCPCVPRRH